MLRAMLSLPQIVLEFSPAPRTKSAENFRQGSACAEEQSRPSLHHMGTEPSSKEGPCLSQIDRHYNHIAVFTFIVSGPLSQIQGSGFHSFLNSREMQFCVSMSASRLRRSFLSALLTRRGHDAIRSRRYVRIQPNFAEFLNKQHSGSSIFGFARMDYKRDHRHDDWARSANASMIPVLSFAAPIF
jgi:hypothetical protein